MSYLHDLKIQSCLSKNVKVPAAYIQVMNLEENIPQLSEAMKSETAIFGKSFSRSKRKSMIARIAYVKTMEKLKRILLEQGTFEK